MLESSRYTLDEVDEFTAEFVRCPRCGSPDAMIEFDEAAELPASTSPVVAIEARCPDCGYGTGAEALCPSPVSREVYRPKIGRLGLRGRLDQPPSALDAGHQARIVDKSDE